MDGRLVININDGVGATVGVLEAADMHWHRHRRRSSSTRGVRTCPGPSCRLSLPGPLADHLVVTAKLFKLLALPDNDAQGM